MVENLFQAQYDITKKTRIKKIYDENKLLIFSFVFILIIFLGSVSFYISNKEKQKILISDNYVKAKIFLANGNKIKAIDLLKNLIFLDDAIYSTLSFFLILDQKLIEDENELSKLFNHLLNNNKMDDELRDLLIYKKILFDSAFVQESKLLEDVKPLLKSGNLWKSHALLLLGDYFVSKKEYIKAQEFYIQIFSLENLNKDLYDETRSRLALIKNEE